MNKAFSLIGAATLGAGAAYLMDPALGKRRRALARDAVVHGANVLRKGVDVGERDMAHRLKGIFEAAKQIFSRAPVSDEVLADHVRSEVGRVSSHPNAEVIVDRGHVTLLGPVVASEREPILRAVWSVKGVHGISDRMSPYNPPPEIQTQTPRERRLDILQRHWAPATRIAVGALGVAMIAASTKLPRIGRATLSAGGLALLSRAATNAEFRPLARLRDVVRRESA